LAGALILAYFFILGAPKCGTTSLAYWLSQHSEIAFSEPKESRFFNTDFSLPFRPSDSESYESLFQDKPNAVLRGEATVNYLCSDVALSKILDYAPDAQFIVCVRPHVELFLSLHKQRLKEGLESVQCPERAWRLQGARLKGRKVPKGCSEPKLLEYSRFCMMGEQISQVYEQVGQKRVRLYQLSEIGRIPDVVFKNACDFLGVDDGAPVSYSVKNVGTVPKYPVLSRLMRALGILRQKIGLRPLGAATLIARVNLAKSQIYTLDPAFLIELEEYFKHDQETLDLHLKNRGSL